MKRISPGGIALRVLVVIAVEALISTTRANEDAAASDSVAVYDVYERAFACANCSSMTDAGKSSQAFTVQFICPDASPIVLPGFWSGGNEWKFRFAPTRPGIWRWTIVASGRSFDRTTGSVNATSASPPNRGFLKQSAINPYTLSYSDGTPAFVWGNTAYKILDTAIQDEKEPNGQPKWKYFVDQTKAHGMKKIRLLVTMWDFGHIYGTDRYPWMHCTKASPEFDAFDQPYWRKLDEVVQYLQAQGIIAELVLFPDYTLFGDRSRPSSVKNPGLYAMSRDQEKLYMKFVIARYAAYSNVIWCLTNEWGASWRSRFCETNYPPGNNANSGNCLWHPEWISGGPVTSNGCQNQGLEPGLGPYMKASDPYVVAEGRLLSNHQKGTGAVNGKLAPDYAFDFWNDDWPTHGVFQMAKYDPGKPRGHDWGNFGIRENWGHGKPVFNDEYGYEDGGNITRELARKAAWGIAVAGGYGTYGDWHKVNQLNVECSMAGIWQSHPSQEDIKVLINFMNGADFQNLSPHNELVTASSPAYVCANPGVQYVMYAADGGSNRAFQIDLPEGTYEAAWYDTTSGAPSKTEAQFQWSGGKKTFIAPADFSTNTDAVLKITPARTKSGGTK